MMKTVICTTCGGEGVTNDAVTRWNREAGDWEISGLFNSNSCDDCGVECSVEAREITPDTRYAVQWRPTPDTGWPWTDAGDFPIREDAEQVKEVGESAHPDREYRVIPVWPEGGAA